MRSWMLSNCSCARYDERSKKKEPCAWWKTENVKMYNKGWVSEKQCQILTEILSMHVTITVTWSHLAKFIHKQWLPRLLFINLFFFHILSLLVFCNSTAIFLIWSLALTGEWKCISFHFNFQCNFEKKPL